MPALSPTEPSSDYLQGVSAPMAATFLISSLVPAVSVSSLAQAMPQSVHPRTAMPQPIVRGASSAKEDGNLSISHSNSKVCSSAMLVGSVVVSSCFRSPSETLETRP